MEPTHDVPASGGAGQAELIVRNGRQRGARRPLDKPLVLIGRNSICDIRLNVDGISDLHCALLQAGPEWRLRVLQDDRATLVNGQPAMECTLADGAELTVGPFRFKVRLPAPGPVSTTTAEAIPQDTGPNLEAQLKELRETLQAQTEAHSAEQVRLQQRWLQLDQHHEEARAQLHQEREAQRVQTAALVAQQVGLNEEETRFRERCTAFQQQEAQISAHLEERQRQLLLLQEQTRQARAELHADRLRHEAQVADAARALAAARNDLADNQRQVHAERRRLTDLWHRLKRRWHRHWAAERASFRKCDANLGRQRNELDRVAEELEAGKAALTQAWLRFNADVEIGRRQLQVAWQELREDKQRWQAQRVREQAELRHRQRELARFEADLTDAERALNDQRQHWQANRLGLEREVQGLESRARNQRRRLQEQEQEVARLESARQQMQAPAGPEAAPAAAPSPEASPQAPVPAASAPEASQQLACLEKLADELADQRTQLTEHCQRLARVEEHWHQQHAAAAAELEIVGHHLAQREQTLEAAEVRLRQMQLEAVHVRQHLEGWQSRLAAREAAWEGEKDRLLAEAQTREHLAQKRLEAVSELHDMWSKRRRLEVDRLQAERTAASQVREECAALREEWLRRHAALERAHRTVAERTLALEQYRQETVKKASQPAVAEKRLHRLHRRAAAVSAAAAKGLARERQALQTEASRLEAGCRELDRRLVDLTNRQAELDLRLQIFEKDRLNSADQEEELRERAAVLQILRDRFEHERGQLREEIDRLSRLLIDEDEKLALPAPKAA